MSVQEAEAINKAIGAKKQWNGQYTLDCKLVSKLPPLGIKINGKMFELEGKDYILNVQGTCMSGFIGLDIPAPAGINLTYRRTLVDRRRCLFTKVFYYI